MPKLPLERKLLVVDRVVVVELPNEPEGRVVVVVVELLNEPPGRLEPNEPLLPPKPCWVVLLNDDVERVVLNEPPGGGATVRVPKLPAEEPAGRVPKPLEPGSWREVFAPKLPAEGFIITGR